MEWMKHVSNETLLKLVIADIVVGLIIGGYLIWLGFSANATAQTAEQNASAVARTAESTYAECGDLNQLKASLAKLIVIVPPPHETSAQKAYIDNLIAQSHRALTQAHCHRTDP